MKSFIASIFIIIIIGTTGCAGKFNYTPPTENTKIKKTVIIDKPKDKVWSKLVQNLGQSFFTINNLDKDSGFINLSYTGDPEKYVDCGTIESTVTNLRGERNYNFPASKGHMVYEIFDRNLNLFGIERKMELQGRININVIEVNKNKTSVSVNVRYGLTKKGRSTCITAMNRPTSYFNDSIAFNTNEGAAFPAIQKTKCYSTGALENDIFDVLIGKK